MNVNVNLSEAQKKRLKKAVMTGSGFSAKLSHANLQGSDMLPVGKVIANKLARHMRDNKGMVVKMTEKDVAKYGNGMSIPFETMTMRGGALTAAAALAGIGMAKEFLDDYPEVTTFVRGITEDIAYLLNNPMAVSFRFIVSTKIPNLNKRYRDVAISIDRLKKIIPTLDKPLQIKRHERRVINLEALRERVGNHIATLIERLPHIKAMAEERNETLKARKAEQLKKQIEATNDKLESLEQKHMGEGIIMDRIKSRIKERYIDPVVEREKAKVKKAIEEEKQKAKREIEKKMNEAKKKAEKEARARFEMEKIKMQSKVKPLTEFMY